MKQGNVTGPGPVERARRELDPEHRALHQMGDRIRRTNDGRTLSGLLADLHRRLSAHFVHEELAAGLYQAIGALGTAQRARVDQLREEHHRLLADTRRLAVRARTHNGDAAEVHRQAEELIDRLRAHEANELVWAEPPPDSPRA